jgi:hypothetical protein
LYTTAAAAAAILMANFFLFSARELRLLLLLCASTLRGYGDVPLRGQPNVGPKSLGSFFFFFFFEKEKNRLYFEILKHIFISKNFILFGEGK